jgi:hypothetical protein
MIGVVFGGNYFNDRNAADNNLCTVEFTTYFNNRVV